MSRKEEIRAMAELLVKTHDGQAWFNFGQVSQIIGCGVNTLPCLLHNAGILVKKVGPSKRISAYDLAAFMSLDRVAPVD